MQVALEEHALVSQLAELHQRLHTVRLDFVPQRWNGAFLMCNTGMVRRVGVGVRDTLPARQRAGRGQMAGKD